MFCPCTDPQPVMALLTITSSLCTHCLTVYSCHIVCIYKTNYTCKYWLVVYLYGLVFGWLVNTEGVHAVYMFELKFGILFCFDLKNVTAFTKPQNTHFFSPTYWSIMVSLWNVCVWEQRTASETLSVISTRYIDEWGLFVFSWLRWIN